MKCPKCNEEIDKKIFCPECSKATSTQYNDLATWGATRLEICVAAASGEDVESLARRLKVESKDGKHLFDASGWSIHAIANFYWSCADAIRRNKARIGNG